MGSAGPFGRLAGIGYRDQAPTMAQTSNKPDTVPVIFDLDSETAAALDDPATRTRVERLIRRAARPLRPAEGTGVEQLFTAMDALSDEGRRRGLTD